MRPAGIAFCAALVIALPALAGAESPCEADARRLCPDVPYGDGRVLYCLRQRWYQVSSACQNVIHDVDNRARQVHASCSGDVFQFCPSVPRGKGRILSCLATAWDNLSSTCRDSVARVSEKLQRFKDACSGDAARFCPDVEPGGGRIFACLKLQERAVSSRCATAMQR